MVTVSKMIASDRLFETDRPLWPDDPAYSDVFNGLEIHPHQLVHIPQAVICSPKKTGKTTQLRWIYALQKRFVTNLDRIAIEVPRHDGGFPEHSLRKLLVQELNATESGSLIDIIQSSKRITDGAGHRIVSVVDADNLHDDALRWLLYGLRNLRTKSESLTKNKVQVIIDGSFALDTMTSGPDSEFPMAQIYPREFNENEQRQFVRMRLQDISLGASEEMYRALWSATMGDKYFTQALCKRVVKLASQAGLNFLSVDEFNDCLDGFVNEDSTDELKVAVVESLRCMSEDCSISEVMLRNVVSNIGSNWESLPKYVRSIAYKGGLVRRTGSRSVILRAPIILSIFSSVERRVRNVKSLLEAYFEVDGVPEPLKPVARGFWREIVGAAFDNSLKALHVGFGRKVNDSEIDLRAVALDHGQYEGTISIKTDSSIRPDDEVWCLVWTREDVSGGTITKCRTLPVKPISTLDVW